MQFPFLLPPRAPERPRRLFVAVGQGLLPVRLIRNQRARRYVLRVQHDGTARLAIPPGGSAAGALDFARRQSRWLERQLRHQIMAQQREPAWRLGTEIFFRGELVKLQAAAEPGVSAVRFGDQLAPVDHCATDLRLSVERRLWQLATRELTLRTHELAALHGLLIHRVVVRNQRTRWGSCSARGVISLNWRLIQTPPWVRDYIILHELAHLRHPNHSRRFWCAVEAACPEFERAEQWLKEHERLLVWH